MVSGVHFQSTRDFKLKSRQLKKFLTQRLKVIKKIAEERLESAKYNLVCQRRCNDYFNAVIKQGKQFFLYLHKANKLLPFFNP